MPIIPVRAIAAKKSFDGVFNTPRLQMSFDEILSPANRAAQRGFLSARTMNPGS
jgi:hypothetical protein